MAEENEVEDVQVHLSVTMSPFEYVMLRDALADPDWIPLTVLKFTTPWRDRRYVIIESIDGVNRL